MAGHFDEAEGAGAENFGAGPIAADGIVQRTFDVAAVAFLAHIDEVVHDDAAEVAEAELAGDFAGGDLVELVGRILGGAIGAEAAAVDVDGDEGLGLVDDERAAAFERHLPLVDEGDLLIEIVLVKQRLAAFVEFAGGSHSAA